MRRRVLITGGARGIGLAIADSFRSGNFDVIAPTRAQLDLANSASLAAFESSGALSEIDILINNAGENNLGTLDDLTLDDWSHMLQVNLTAAFMLSRAAFAGMKLRGWGRIVNISSIYGIISRAARGGYSASKAGLQGLTRTAAIEFGPSNVLVNAVAPGFVDTELTRKNNSIEVIQALCDEIPLRRLAQPAEIARVVYFLGSDENTYISGETVVVDGGYLAK